MIHVWLVTTSEVPVGVMRILVGYEKGHHHRSTFLAITRADSTTPACRGGETKRFHIVWLVRERGGIVSEVVIGVLTPLSIVG